MRTCSSSSIANCETRSAIRCRRSRGVQSAYGFGGGVLDAAAAAEVPVAPAVALLPVPALPLTVAADEGFVLSFFFDDFLVVVAVDVVVCELLLLPFVGAVVEVGAIEVADGVVADIDEGINGGSVVEADPDAAAIDAADENDIVDAAEVAAAEAPVLGADGETTLEGKRATSVGAPFGSL